MPELPPHPPVEPPITPDGVINTDAPCRKCGYNLRGLQQDQRCPECGTLTSIALHGSLLRYADPQWLAQLSSGITLMLWGILVSIIAGIAGSSIAELASLGSAAENAVTFIGELVGYYGAWRLTQPDPSGIGEDAHVTARKIVRFGLLLGLISDAVNIAAAIPASTPFLVGLALSTVSGAGLLAAFIGEIAKFFYIEKLANRIPDPSLATLARNIRWGFIILAGAAVLIGIIVAALLIPTLLSTPATTTAPATTPTTAPGGGTLVYQIPGGGRGTMPVSAWPAGAGALAIIGGCFLGLGVVILGIATLVLYFKLRKALAEQLTIARKTWSTNTDPTTPYNA
jgi:hypothetical protein